MHKKLLLDVFNRACYCFPFVCRDFTDPSTDCHVNLAGGTNTINIIQMEITKNGRTCSLYTFLFEFQTQLKWDHFKTYEQEKVIEKFLGLKINFMLTWMKSLQSWFSPIFALNFPLFGQLALRIWRDLVVSLIFKGVLNRGRLSFPSGHKKTSVLVRTSWISYRLYPSTTW